MTDAGKTKHRIDANSDSKSGQSPVSERNDIRRHPTGEQHSPQSATEEASHPDILAASSEGATGTLAADEPTLVVGIGASAGGLAALERVFRAMPPNLGAAYVVIVHLSPNAKSMMAELIGHHTQMPVHTVESGMKIKRDHIYVIPPDHNVLVRAGRLTLALQDRSPGHGALYPVDIFFESLALEVRSRAVAIILSGTGSDGSRGIRHIRDQGGVVLIQSRESAQFDGMPASALATGLWDLAASPEELASKVAQLVAQTAQAPGEPGVGDSRASSLLAELRNGSGLDFGYIKLNVLARRTWRRMMLLGVHDFDEYLSLLSTTRSEVLALRDDLLINVTAFFRDSSAFRVLATDVLPQLLLSKPAGEDLRVWVPACASGEEAYSIAMVLHELVSVTGGSRDFRIFATDVDENALERAHRGIYTESSIRDLPTEYRRRFVQPHGEAFSIDPALRERLIFSRHNVMTAPPFTHMDLVSCRNLLIYLTKEAHESLVAALHFSLEMKGILLLGAAESVSPYEKDFSCVNSPARIFRKKTDGLLAGMRNRNTTRIAINSGLSAPGRRTESSRHELQSFRRVLDVLSDRDERLIALLDAEGMVVELLGESEGILRVPRGRPTNDILKLVSDRLRTPLATALRRVGQGEERVRYSVESESSQRATTIDVEALPATGQLPHRILLTVQFDDRGTFPASVQSEPTDAQKARIRAIELELQRTQESLQATIEQLQAANEEQQTTNEELLSANQELQSTNEELQSVNEELHTINVEYQQKNQELSLMASDLENLIRNIGVGSLYLDSEHRIRKFTPAMRRVFSLVEHDIGRPIEAFAHALATDLAVGLEEVARERLPIEREVRDKTGAWLLMRTAPYTLRTGEIDGAIITFVEITKLKNSEESAQIMNAQLSQANQRLGEQSEELEELFSIVAHDLKRPVMALDGSLKLMREELHSASGVSDDARRFMDMSILECERMRNLLLDLANISRINRQELALETFDLQPWLARFLERYTQQITQRSILLNATCDPVSVRAPRAALEQCLGNLVENAIRYGSSNPSPRIDVSCQLRGDELFIAVVDNGPGIAPEHHERVFELFRRLAPDKSDGSGVGLVAVRRLVARAKGKVALESEPGRGARFQIQIPIELEETPVPRILLVEDDSLDAKSILHCLRGIRTQHEWVCDLANAALLLEQRRFDIVILDLSLPDGHGLRIIPKLQQANGDRIPCIIVSGHGAGLSQEFEVHFARFIDKNDLSPHSLQDALEDLLPHLRNSLSATGADIHVVSPPAEDSLEMSEESAPNAIDASQHEEETKLGNS